MKYHQTRLKENKSRKTNLDPKTWGTQMKITTNEHLTRKMNLRTRRNLTPERFFKVKTNVINVEILNT